MGGYLRNGLEVSDPLTASALYTHSNGNWIKGMVVVEQNDLELVLLGLITGEVYKVCLFVCLFVCLCVCLIVCCLFMFHYPFLFSDVASYSTRKYSHLQDLP